MEIKEMIRKVYKKNGIQVDDDYIEYKMKDEKNVKGFMRLYKQEEMDSMNYILGKDKDNKVFTKFELEAMNKIDLFNRKVVEVCKIIWEKEVLGGTN
jgi:hypothetical protein